MRVGRHLHGAVGRLAVQRVRRLHDGERAGVRVCVGTTGALAREWNLAWKQPPTRRLQHSKSVHRLDPRGGLSQRAVVLRMGFRWGRTRNMDGDGTVEQVEGQQHLLHRGGLIQQPAGAQPMPPARGTGSQRLRPSHSAGETGRGQMAHPWCVSNASRARLSSMRNGNTCEGPPQPATCRTESGSMNDWEPAFTRLTTFQPALFVVVLPSTQPTQQSSHPDAGTHAGAFELRGRGAGGAVAE
jgi:hypothetical protein